jgi:hypothetical protein
VRKRDRETVSERPSGVTQTAGECEKETVSKRERETVNRPNRADESPTANSARESAPKFFHKKKRERERKRSSPDFGQIPARSHRNLAGYRRNYCLRSILGKKNQKWSRAGHVTTFPSVNGGLIDRVPDIEKF